MARIRTPYKALGLGSGPLRRLLLGFGIGIGLIVLTWGAGRLVSAGSDADTGPEKAPSPAATVPADAAEDDPAGAETGADAGLGGLAADPDLATPGEVLVSLCVVVAVLVGVLLVVGRLMRRARLAPGTERTLRLEDALSLGAKRQIFAVGYKDRTLILGCGGEEVTLLAEYAGDDLEAVRDAEPDHVADREAVAAEEASPVPHGPAVRIELSPAARRAASTAAGEAEGDDPKELRGLPSGAHRVPKAFRHLLERTLEQGSGR